MGAGLERGVGCTASRFQEAKKEAGSYCAVMSRTPNPRLLVDVLVEVLPRYEYYSECPS